MLSSSPQPSVDDAAAAAQRCVTPNRNISTESYDAAYQQQHPPPQWSQLAYECDVFARLDGSFEFIVEGGSDNGEFPFFGSNHGTYQNISRGDIILEIQGQKVAGYTQRDVIAWLAHCSRNGNVVKIKAVKTGYLTKDLRQYLNSRFQKGSLDHDLQNTIRDNLYLRTVPCTTRPPRCGEINGVDYTFLSVEEFIALERSGNLLESGIYEGNLYGTPRPAPAASAFSASISNLVQSTGWMVKPNIHGNGNRHVKESTHSPAKHNSVGHIMPGAHASSEGKRRRNRSNVEAMASKTTDACDYPPSTHTRSSTPVINLPNIVNYKQNHFIPFSSSSPYDQDFSSNADTQIHNYMGNNQGYYLTNHNGSHWMDSRSARPPPQSSFGDCDNDLPFGWERIDDPHYGTYYIDHVNRRTQYENPVLHARTFDQNATPSQNLTSRSPSWHSKLEQRSENSRSLGPCSPLSDSKISPRTSRNSSLTHTTNCSNAHDSVTPANTNSESPLIDGNSSVQPIATSSNNNPLSSSPATNHRFPYLHCIPCLNEKHDPPKHQLSSDDGSKPDSATHLPNGTIHSDAASDRIAQSSTLIADTSCHANFSSIGQGSDSTCRDFSHPSSSLTGFNTNTIPKQPAFFTRNPDELRGIMLLIPLVKSSRGLGFTIIGGDNPSSQEFLQIKDVVPYGPAWCDGKLQTGDVLVHVNNTCVLGYSHKDIVSLFQSIPPGEIVELEVCRGYPLPFDPNDPNTEILTTVAVSLASSKSSFSQNVYSISQPNSNSRLMNSTGVKYTEPISRTAKSLPDLSSRQPSFSNQHNTATGIHNATMPSKDPLDEYYSSSKSPKRISIGIIKGTAGFGFTIADSSYGQKVKKILDRPRCKQLQEGDILIEINGMLVREMPHADVVQILKECPCGNTAEIVVQRDGILQPVRHKGPIDNYNSAKRYDLNESTGLQSSMHHISSGRREEKIFNNYRSKTPTAELYSTRDKDAVVVPRPKTPLVDSRNWTKSSPENNLSFGFTEKQNLFSGISSSATTTTSSRHRKRNDFKNGEQLDRETTDYLLCEPSYKSSVNHHHPHHNQTWYSPNNHGNFNSEPFAESNVMSLNKQFQNMSSHFEKKPKSLDRSYLSSALDPPNENGVSKSGEDNSTSDNPDTLDSDWKYSGNSSSSYYNNHRSPLPSNAAFYDSFRQSQDNNFGLFTAQPTSNYQAMTLNHVNSSALWNGNASIRESSSATNSLHHRMDQKSQNSFIKREDNSIDQEHIMPNAGPLQSLTSNDMRNVNNQSSVSSSDGFINMTVTLYRQNNGFGFRVVGGTEEGSQVCVGHIVPGGAADLDGHLQTGDELLAIDGISVVNSSHQNVIQLMNNTATNGQVTLHIRRPNPSSISNGDNRKIGNRYDVTLVRSEEEGFGFVLISSLNRKGSAIGRITEGSPAERCSQLHIGDVIEAVNGVSILDMHHGDIVGLIKDSGLSITLTINHIQDDSSSAASTSQKEDESLFDSNDGLFNIELQRGSKGFGFSIRGGKEFHNMPLFVLRIAENGPAHQDGRIKVGDQIMEINSVSTKMMTHADAIELIREGGSTVRLLVKRNNQSMPMLAGTNHRLPSHASPNHLFQPVGSENTVHMISYAPYDISCTSDIICPSDSVCPI